MRVEQRALAVTADAVQRRKSVGTSDGALIQWQEIAVENQLPGGRCGCLSPANIPGEEFVTTNTRKKQSRSLSFAAGVGRALRRAAKVARKIARMYGTPLYVWENGRVVAKKP